MLDIVLMVIGVISIGITINGDIKAYGIGVYNPYKFRMRVDYEWEKSYMISYFGYFIPMFVIHDVFNKFVYIAILFSSLCLSMVIFNYKCFKFNRDRRILIETLIVSTIYITIIFMFYSLI